MQFEAELIEGHKGVMAVIVPFDPEKVWRSPPVRLDPRRDGWLVEGTVNGTRFEGYIGQRWGRFFLMVDADLRDLARVKLGDMLSVIVDATTSPTAFAKARIQSRMTTAPKRGRADAIVLPEPAAPPRRKKR